jgi:hypothetical protein
MKVLVPERVSFRISTTDLILRYAERARTTIAVQGTTIDGPTGQSSDVAVEIAFDLVAEVRCVSMNFFEAEHGDYTVDKEPHEDARTFWAERGYCVDPGFYSVRESPWLRATEKRYDPRGRFGLRHYLVAGYDSHVELLAGSYVVTVGEVTTT